MKAEFNYLLGDSRQESARLSRQSQLWDPVTFALFDRLKLKKGMRVLEIGPGRGSIYFELRKRVRGSIDAVERSPVFARSLAELSKKDSFGEGQVWISDLIDSKLPRNHYDLIFTRWVFLFLPNPQAHLKKLLHSLKPGGRLVIQDYHRETLGMVPTPRHWQEFLAADQAFFKSQGGNASVGNLIPDLLRELGVDQVQVEVHIKTGHPGSATWNWLTDYFMMVLDRYSKFKPFSKSKAQALRQDWKAYSQEPSSVLIAPTLVDIVATKS